ncbi:glycosyltransferase family 2 protein [Leucobacter insecticola]|uniref:Glycosyltransferase family 2 protein n=1 Tax=Leucobacter insecticola TaxID=2714934 RepID=A0A6G8FII7_9MICO|nr:glycosyltransferase family 2 protein [Leucobacter insecticola]QIM15862.1 glycosyltransferase family 2 protein [Leucobacter insecticola]
MTKPRTLVILPAWNEEKALPDLLAELVRECPDVDVLVIDDASTDNTNSAARTVPGVRVLSLPINIGVGGATRAGLLYGERGGYEAVVQCDADGQHPPADIPRLVAQLKTADMVIGARFAGADGYQVRGPRRWAMRLLSRVFSRMHRVRLTDTTSGFRAFGPQAISLFSQVMPPEYLGDTVDALVIAKRHRLRVEQVPVAMRERQAGTASHGSVLAGVFLARALFILLLSLPRLVIRRRKAQS